MLGKTLGRVVGEVIASPITLISEGEKAINEAAETIDRRLDDAEKGSKKKGGE